jgi:hypothetical protein
MARPTGVHPPGSQSGWSFFVAIVVLIAVQIFFAQWILHGLDKPPAEHMAWRGQLGDMFGGVNAFFTGAAFVGVTFTLILQRRENAAQRDAIAAQQAALDRSVEVQTEQVATLRQQREAQIEQVAALKVAANLSATTALMNAYGARLAPYWAQRMSLNLEYERYSREVDVAQEKITKAKRDSFDYVYLERRLQELRNCRHSVYEQISNIEDFWRHDVDMQDDLVARLEELVEQAQ